MGIFAGMKTAKASSSSKYLEAGHYWLAIKRCKVGETRKKAEFYANEFEVVKVINDNNGAGHRENEEVTHMIMASTDGFLGDIKSFICALLDQSQEDVDEDMCEGITKMDGEDAQPLKYMVVEARCTDVPTKSGGLFTKVKYVREVPIDEVIDNCDPDVMAIAFPDEVLETLLGAGE